ncbi:MAG: GTPase Era [Bacteroidia bacterium]|nr:GTPase Era [Bacteroidia bacterium]
MTDTPDAPNHRSGFVALVGKPNVGKSTLLNALLEVKLSIVSAKPSTTRHRVLGILSGEGYQAVLLDTPGIIVPKYGLHTQMMESVKLALQDADLVVWLVAPIEPFPEQAVIDRLRQAGKPVLLAVNKADLATDDAIAERTAAIADQLPLAASVSLSALHGTRVAEFRDTLVSLLPLGPPYYPKDQLTDRSERFIVGELVREQVFVQFQEEIPYNTEVTVLLFEERNDGYLYIDAEIHVGRKSLKGMLIGKGGQAIKKLGVAARAEIEAFLGRPVYLNLYVRIAEDWKNHAGYLKSFGYGA